jgi:drug/metabolite transporter (DMT)-like permease
MSGKSKQRDVFVGIALIVAAQACFASGDGGVKLLTATVPFVVIVGLRYVLSFFLFTSILRPWRDPSLLRTKKPWMQIARAGAMLIATASSFGALHWLSVMQNASVGFTSPLFIAALSGPLLGEVLGWRRVCAVAVGFIGVLVVTRPGIEGGLPPAALLSLLCALSNAFTAIISRKLVPYDAPSTTMFYSTTIGAAVMAPLLWLAWKTPLSGGEWAIAILMGVLGTLGHWFFVTSHRVAPASTLAPFMYVHLLFSMIVSLTLFGNVPDFWTLAGSAIIAAAGLYIIHRERVHHMRPIEEDLPI